MESPFPPEKQAQRSPHFWGPVSADPDLVAIGAQMPKKLITSKLMNLLGKIRRNGPVSHIATDSSRHLGTGNTVPVFCYSVASSQIYDSSTSSSKN